MLIRHKDLADLLGVSSQRISQAKRLSDIVSEPDKSIDTDNPVNRAYIRAHFYREYMQERRTDDEDGDSLVELEREELEEKIRYTSERADERALMNAKRRGDLFPRDLVLEYFSGFASGLRTYILPIPVRVAPRIEAALKTGSGDAVEIMEAEIRDGIERAIALGKGALREASETIDEEEIDDEVEDDISGG
jgi:phage terminase Nu1 subunit (DNA packaging protein)